MQIAAEATNRETSGFSEGKNHNLWWFVTQPSTHGSQWELAQKSTLAQHFCTLSQSRLKSNYQ
jgi:hypothetical protein